MKLFKEELKKVEAFAFDDELLFTLTEMNITPGRLDSYILYERWLCHDVLYEEGLPGLYHFWGQAPGVRERFEKLGVKDVYLGVANKVEALNEFLQKYNLNPENVMYMGDDIPDYNVMKIVGMPVVLRMRAKRSKLLPVIFQIRPVALDAYGMSWLKS